MKEVDFKTYKILLVNKSVSKSVIPKSVLHSDTFQNLLQAEILKFSKLGRGFKVEVSKEIEFKKFLNSSFPEQNVSKTKSGNIKKYRNSKATKIDSSAIFLFRGFSAYQINEQIIDLEKQTRDFGLFSVIPISVIADKICFVENLETFLNAEKLLGNEFLFAHKYGRIGKESISMIKAKEVLVFVDYDFNGLDEYLRIKNVFENARLYIPSNYNELFKRHSASLKGNKAKMSKAVKTSDDSTVIKIREQVARTNRFLEQETLINV
jgi:5S rRNA maturation endonuclease (ribonuclease M5)